MTACKQETKNSVEKILVSENKKSTSNDGTIPKLENAKLEQKVDSKNQKKSLPFPPPPIPVFDEYNPPFVVEKINDYQPERNIDNPDGIQVEDDVQEEPKRRINFSANNQDEPYTIVDEIAEFSGGKIKFLEYLEKT